MSYTLENTKEIFLVTKHYGEDNETLKSENFTFEELIKTQEELIDKYKQALDEIENSLKTIMETNRVYPLQANLQKVLNIINKVKEKI